MIKKIVALLLMSTFMLAGCTPETNIQTSTQTTQTQTQTKTNDVTTTKELIESATIIKVKKMFFSINNSYDVYVDDTKIGNISGKFVNVTGDVFTFKTENGYTIGKEKQIKRWNVKLNRLAEVFDENDNTVGYIGENKIQDFFKWGYNFHFYDSDKNDIAHSKDIFFSLLSKYEIYNNDNEKICTIEEQFTVDNQYIITIEEGNNVPVEQLIYFTCILDAISSAEKD